MKRAGKFLKLFHSLLADVNFFYIFSDENKVIIELRKIVYISIILQIETMLKSLFGIIYFAIQLDAVRDEY